MPIRGRTRKAESVLPDVVSNLNDAERLALASERLVYLRLAELIENHASFIAVAETILGVTLTVNQKHAASFLFDGVAPPPEAPPEIFGSCTRAPDKDARRTAVAVCGRGSGKTSIFLALQAIHLALTVDCSAMGAGDPPGLVAIVGPSLLAAQHTLQFVKGYFGNTPLLSKILRIEATKERLLLTRPHDGRQVTIEARAASGGGAAVRGPSLLGVLMDEAAFFYGEGYEVNDKEIFDAATPRLLDEGQIVIASSPWGQSGLLWDLYRDNFGSPLSAVVVKAPSLLMHPTEAMRVAYENMMRVDPDNAMREFDSQFMSSSAERFFPETTILRCLGPESDAISVPGDVATGERVLFGADFGFAVDSSALVGFAERARLTPVSLLELKPEPGMPLVPSKVVDTFAEEIKRCGARLVTADDWYRQTIEEHLGAHRLALVPAPRPPAAAFIVARSLMSQGRVILPNNPRLLAQLRRVRSTVKPGGVVSVHQPRVKEGGHGDIVSAMVCALSGCSVEAQRPASAKPIMERLAEAERRAQTERLKANEDKSRKGASRMLKSLTSGLRKGKLWQTLMQK